MLHQYADSAGESSCKIRTHARRSSALAHASAPLRASAPFLFIAVRRGAAHEGEMHMRTPRCAALRPGVLATHAYRDGATHLKVRIFFLSLLCLVAVPAHAAMSVFACEPEWAALAAELGGEHVEAWSATTARQDPHRIEPGPNLVERARRARLLVCTGVGLEAGWLPQLLRQAANPAIQEGQLGHFLAAKYVTMLEVPTAADRDAGGVHPDGNPHIQLDPDNIRAAAVALGERLEAIDGANSAYYDQRTADFLKRWDEASARWAKLAEPLRGMTFVADHKGWTYMANWLGLEEVTALEPRPGLPPSAARLAELVAQLSTTPAQVIVRADYQDDRPARWLSGKTGLPIVTLPFTVGGSGTKTLFDLFDKTLQLLLKERP